METPRDLLAFILVVLDGDLDGETCPPAIRQVDTEMRIGTDLFDQFEIGNRDLPRIHRGHSPMRRRTSTPS